MKNLSTDILRDKGYSLPSTIIRLLRENMFLIILSVILLEPLANKDKRSSNLQ